MRKITRKGLVRRLDALVKEIVIKRDGKCIVCGTTKNLTPGHLFSRVAYSTRWDLDNVYAQCLSCNLKHEYDPYPMTEVVLGIFAAQRETDDPENLYYDRGHQKLEELHYKYVHPVKFKDFQLQELYDNLAGLDNPDLNVGNENTGDIDI